MVDEEKELDDDIEAMNLVHTWKDDVVLGIAGFLIFACGLAAGYFMWGNHV